MSAVDSRIKRARALWRLMYHDSLTGLLNQITLKLPVGGGAGPQSPAGEPSALSCSISTVSSW